jgi:aromatic-L-amino-acid decarboxylase
MATTEPQRVAATTARDPLLERLHQLEKLTAPLHPDAETREELTEAAFVHAEALNDALERGATKPYESRPEPVRPDSIGIEAHDPASVFSHLIREVDSLGHSPHAGGFFGYIPGGNLYHAAIADYLAAVSNRFTGSFLASPGAVRIENQVLAWLASVVGYPASSAGYVASGASLANLSAIVAAREAAGLTSAHIPRASVYTTDQVHHCIPKGLRIAGLGECPVRHVPTDSRWRMDVAALDRAIESDVRAGLIPWLIVATAGTTDTGAVDPLDAIADVAKHHRVWLHVDGAYGGMFMLCDEGRSALHGLSRSDSVVVDQHKGLFLPYGVGTVLVKNADAMRAAHRFEASYVPEEIHHTEEVSPCLQSPELSRPFRALRVWLPLMLLGTRPFEAALEEKLLLARYAHRRLSELAGIEVGPEPDLSVVVFRLRGGEEDERNRRFERMFLEDGRVFLGGTRLNGRRWLRLAVLASRSHQADVDRAIEVIAEKSRQV